MLRIKHKNISMQFITLAVLCLCCGLMMYLSLPPAYAAQPPQQPYYVVDAYQTPGVVYRIESRRRKPDVFIRRCLGTIYSIALWEEQLYFCSANDRRIYFKKLNEPERVVFTHNTYIRDIAVDPSGYLYFSVASGAGGDGRIYQLTPPVNNLGPKDRFSISSTSRNRPVQVHLKTVNGFWAGDFTFDEQGNLYLSTGNRSPAFIYKVPKEKGGQYGSPRRLYRDTKGAIKGIAIDPSNPDFIYYADWKQAIYKLNLRDLGRRVAFSGSFSVSGKAAKSRSQHLSDIAFDIRGP